MSLWRRFHQRRWFVRWPAKGFVLAATVFFVCFPYPWLFVRHVRRWQDPNSVVEPDAPQLAPWVDEVQAQNKPGTQPPQVLRQVESFVYDHVPYAYDWETWGVADYLPTVAEVFEKGQEDCDGRAVIAASMLRKLGFRADLVTDFAHVWVRTDQGDTMSPGRPPAVVAQERGFKINYRAVTDLIPAAAYGLSPFPLLREAIILCVLWLLLLAPGVGRAVPLASLAGLWIGLEFMRFGGEQWKHPVSWMQWVGTLTILLSVGLLLVRGLRTRAARRPFAAGAAPVSPPAAAS